MSWSCQRSPSECLIGAKVADAGDGLFDQTIASNFLRRCNTLFYLIVLALTGWWV